MGAKWVKSNFGWLKSDGKTHLVLRGPLFRGWLKKGCWWWLYVNGSRYTPTGKYDDAVRFEKASDGKKFADSLKI